MPRHSALIAALAVLGAGARAAAQATAAITGQVTEAARGAPLAGITVAVRGSAGAVTGADGRYSLSGVAPGADTIVFRWIGYRPREVIVIMTAGERKTLDVALERAAVNLAEVVVTAASRSPERVVDAPAAVSVVEPERIREMAGDALTPTLVADLPGVHAPQSGNEFNLNVRGFNTTTNRRLLVLVDGRDVSAPILGSQDWPSVMVFEEGTHVELLRGPGAALYGANAFTGVLAINAPTVREALGTRLSVTAGELGTRRVEGRQAGTFGGERWGYRLSGGYGQNNPWDQARTNIGDLKREYAHSGISTDSTSAPAPGYELVPLIGQTKAGPFGVPGAAAGNPDPTSAAFGAGRLDYYGRNGSLITAEGGTSRIENFINVNSTGRGEARAISLPWARVAWNADDFSLMAWYSGRSGHSLSLASGQEVRDIESSVHVEGQINRRFAGDRGRIVLGGSVRNVHVDSRGTLLDAADDGRNDQLTALFEQVDFTVAPRLTLVAGSRVDGGSEYPTQFSPKVGLVYALARDQSLRLTVNRGFLSPSVVERFLYAPAGPPLDLSAVESGLRASPLGAALQGVPSGTLFTHSSAVPLLALGNPDLDPERVNGVELGYKGQVGRAFLTADLYYSHIDDFATATLPGVNPAYAQWKAPPAVPESARPAIEGAVAAALGSGITRLADGSTAYVLSFGNAGRAHEWGSEVGAGIRVTDRLRVDATYTFYDFRLEAGSLAKGDSILPNTPPNTGNLSATWTAAQDNGLIVRAAVHVDETYAWRSGLWAGQVPANQMVDVNIAYPFNDALRFDVSATNLFDQRHYELFGGAVSRRRLLTRLSWRR